MTRFSWIDDDLRHDVHKSLSSPMPRGRDPLRYLEYPRHLDKNSVDGKPHIIFIGYYPYPSIIKRAIPLFESGKFYLTFLGCCIREDYEILKFFDQAFEVNNYEHLFEIIKDSTPQSVHVTIQPNILGVIAAEFSDNYRLVLDIVDSQLFQERNPRSPSVRIERLILSRSAFLIHKLPTDGLNALLNAYDINIPNAAIQSLPWPSIFQDKTPLSPPWRIAYAGGVMPYHIAKARGFGHHIFDPIIESLTTQGIDLTFYVNQNARNMFWEEQDRYVQMAREHSNFNFLKGEPFHKITSRLAEHHYGLLYDNFNESNFDSNHFKYNYSSKIFTYLEAGLPIISHNKFSYMTNFILDNGLGIIYDLDQIGSISSLIEQTKYLEVKNNVRKFRSKHSLDKTLPLLLEAFALES